MSKKFLTYNDAQAKLGNSPITPSNEFVNKLQLTALGADPAPLAKYGNREFVVDEDVVRMDEKIKIVIYFRMKNGGGMFTQKTNYIFEGYWIDAGINHGFTIFQIPNYLVDNNYLFQGGNTFPYLAGGEILQITDKTLDQLWAGNYNYSNVLDNCNYKTIASIPSTTRNFVWYMDTIDKNRPSGAYVFAIRAVPTPTRDYAVGLRVWYPTPEAYFIDKDGNHTAFSMTMDW